MANLWRQLDGLRLSCVALALVATSGANGATRPYLAVAEPAPLRFKAPSAPASPVLLASLTLPPPEIRALPARAAPASKAAPKAEAAVVEPGLAGKTAEAVMEESVVGGDEKSWESSIFGTNVAFQGSQPVITAQMLLDLLRNGPSGVLATNSAAGPVFLPPLPPVRPSSSATYRTPDP